MSGTNPPLSSMSSDPPVVRPDMMRNRLPQQTPDPPYSSTLPSQNQPQQQRQPPQQYQPPSQYQPPAPMSQVSQQPQASHLDARISSGPESIVQQRTPPPVRQPSQSIESTILPSGKPVVKEVTITLSGKLPTMPAAPDVVAPAAEVRRVVEERQAPPVVRPNMESREPQQRVFENRPAPEKPVHLPPQQQQQHVQNTYREQVSAPKPRPTELPLQPERPTSRSGRTAPAGSWCSKTGRFIPDPDARVEEPAPVAPLAQPEPITPLPRRKKIGGGSYCPKTGRYIPAQDMLGRKAMTPRGDEFRVKFADLNVESETPRYLKKEKRTAKLTFAFGSVWTPREEKPQVRRAKSADWLEQRNAITPRGDGRDRDFAKSVEHFDGEDRRHFSRSSSSRSSLRRTNNQDRLPDYSNVTPRVSSFNEHYQPSGGIKKVISTKLQWNAKSKVDSFGQREQQDRKSAPPEKQNAVEKKQEKKDYVIRQNKERETAQPSDAQYNYTNSNEDDAKRFPRSRVK